MTVPLPPVDLANPNFDEIPEGSILHRVHATACDGRAFNPCQGDPTRFAPIWTKAGVCIPTLYAAETLESAVFETIFHDVEPTARFKAVRRQAIDDRSHTELKAGRALQVVTLHAPDHMKWGLQRKQLAAANPRWYEWTARWAEAIHRSAPDCEGLVWTSNRCDPAKVFVFFGDRVEERAFSVVTRRDAMADPALVDEIRACGSRAGIFLSK